MYKALKKAKIKAKYEGKTFEIVSGFDFIHPCYERTANGRGEFKQRGPRIKSLNVLLMIGNGVSELATTVTLLFNYIHITVRDQTKRNM